MNLIYYYLNGKPLHSEMTENVPEVNQDIEIAGKRYKTVYVINVSTTLKQAVPEKLKDFTLLENGYWVGVEAV